jgi:hypothetical protein
MEVQELIAGARDAVSVTRVYGDPYEKNGLTVIPAATVRGGGGAGQGEKEGAETGTGGGFGLTARPAGAWIIEGGHADWKAGDRREPRRCRRPGDRARCDRRQRANSPDPLAAAAAAPRSDLPPA